MTEPGGERSPLSAMARMKDNYDWATGTVPVCRRGGLSVVPHGLQGLALLRSFTILMAGGQRKGRKTRLYIWEDCTQKMQIFPRIEATNRCSRHLSSSEWKYYLRWG